MRYGVFLCCAAGVAAAFGQTEPSRAELRWTLANGSVVTESVPLAEGDDALVLRVPAERIRRMQARRLEAFPDFGAARQGDAGYWFSPYGYYGEWDCADGEFVAETERMNMPMYGWATPSGAWLAIVTSLPYYGNEVVRAEKGRYRIGYRIGEELCRSPYEDLEIAYRRRPAGTGYAALARIYRDYQLARGAVRPLAERVKGNPVLKAAVEAPEIRLRMAWKPVPSPEPYQQPENEPPVRVAITFERLKDIIRELKAQGVEKAELCLVGWNIGGHDGRWPQHFPAEPRLGGDAKLVEAIRAAREAGYLIVPHGNFIEGYTIAEDWDYEFTAKDEDGLPQLAGKTCWGGGQPIRICPQRAFERVCGKTVPRLAAFGFKGLGYFDVVSILLATSCCDPRHPCTRRQGAAWWGRCAELAKRHLGGFASEGPMDHFAGSLDSVLYASFDPPEKIAKRHAEGKSLAKGHRPIFQLVYNGIIVSNPFTSTVNFTAQEKPWQLKFLEYGGRPNFYFYSKFMTDPARNWMGTGDLSCGTDEELRRSVALVKEGAEIYNRLVHLQYAFMSDHAEVAPGVFKTTWSTGDSLTVDYNAPSWEFVGTDP